VKRIFIALLISGMSQESVAQKPQDAPATRPVSSFEQQARQLEAISDANLESGDVSAALRAWHLAQDVRDEAARFGLDIHPSSESYQQQASVWAQMANVALEYGYMEDFYGAQAASRRAQSYADSQIARGR
jgi:cytochrome c556